MNGNILRGFFALAAVGSFVLPNCGGNSNVASSSGDASVTATGDDTGTTTGGYDSTTASSSGEGTGSSTSSGTGSSGFGGSSSSSSGSGASSSSSSSSGATSSSSSSSSGSSSGPTVPLIQGGQSGTTTRYWDCCKPACAWNGGSTACDMNDNPIGDKNAQSACSGGNAYTCWDLSPWSVSSQLSYGFAAVNGSNYGCGRCYQLDLHGGGLDGKSMIVQVINQGGDVGGNQFDLLIPGGGVGQFDACSAQWGTNNLGQQYGGFLASCGSASCVTQMCQQVFGNNADLMAGCSWFTTWFNATNNPTITYQQTSCPSDITAKSGMSG